MKKIIFTLLFIFFLLFNNISFAANSPEDTCIRELSNAIKNDSRFNDPNVFKNGRWLKNVLYDEVNNSYIDISKYSKFLNNLVINPASGDSIHQNLINNNWFNSNDFIARRTNIATVVTSNNFVVSNIVWFWKDSNFNFPLSAVSWNPYWDAYKLNWIFFKEYVAYTHHSYNWDFLSCGIVKIKPLAWNSFTSIDETWYKTNVLTWNNCNSWFQWSDIVKNNYTYYKMKTNVCVTDYTDTDYLKMEVVSLAYKNNSSYFSDYVAHNLQVQAMKDLTNQQKGLYWIRQIFLRYLDQWTCSKLLHTSTSTLPAFCNWIYSSNFNLSWINISDINALVYTPTIINSSIAWLFNMFLPQADAFRKFKNMDTLLEDSRWIMALDNIPYDLYKKLQNIKDNSFKNYLTLAISPNLEDLIKNRRNNGIVVSPYEDVFLKCNIKYPEREKIVIDFLKNLKDPKNIDFSNLKYTNPKFWDCIVPYPDKENLNKEISLSFGSNKLLAKKINWTYKYPELGQDILNLIEKEKNINSDYEKNINELTKKFNSNEITGEELNKKILDEKKIYDLDLKNNYLELNKLEKNKEKKIVKQINNDLTDINKKTNNFDINTLIIVISLILLWFLVIFLSIRRKK